MTGTKLLQVCQAVKSVVAAISTGTPPGTPLFKGVFINGEAVDVVSLPIAIIEFDAADVTRHGNPCLHRTLPFVVNVIYDVPLASFPDPSVTPLEVHCDIAGELIEAFHTNIQLIVTDPLTSTPGPALTTDTRYMGGEGDYSPADGGEEDPPATWQMAIGFQTDFQTSRIDMTTNA